ncbi:hypothetical protein [Kitasatospora cineracea]|nr:hypothetical protein [Kitasatospora cineracea]
MLTPEDAAYLTTAVEGLAEPLYRSLDEGYSNAHKHYDKHEMVGNGYTKGRTDLARDHARRELEKLHEGDLSDWKVVDGSSGRLHLNKGTLTLRVLHASPVDLVPAPGRNKARISYFRNPAIDLFGVEASNLLAIWISPPPTGGDISIRIVRPIGDWKPGRPPKFDLDLELPRNVETFEGWEFDASESGIILPFEFDEDIREEGSNGGA